MPLHPALRSLIKLIWHNKRSDPEAHDCEAGDRHTLLHTSVTDSGFLFVACACREHRNYL